MIVTRRRAWLLCLASFIAMFAYPLWWLLGLPQDLWFTALDARATGDVDRSLDGVVRVRWFTRGIHTMASGYEEDDYFALAYAGGASVVVRDSCDGRLRARLAARGLLPAAATSLGSTRPLAWLGWLAATGFALSLWLVISLVCCERAS